MAADWSTQEWLDDVRQWLSDVLTRVHGTGVIEMAHHSVRPWSTVWTVSCNGFSYWFKANVQAHLHEGSVQSALADLSPEHVDAPLAVEPSRGWILSRDGGPILLQSSAESRGIELDSLTTMLVDYARFQRQTLHHRERLVSLGVHEAPPQDAPEIARAQATYLRALPAKDPRRISDDQYDRVISALPMLGQAAKTLAAGAVPLALDQGDLWPGNVILPSDASGCRFLDFADASWGHPFASLVMLAAECVYGWRIPQPAGEIDLRDNRVRKVFGTYLRQWTDFAPAEELWDLARCALQTAPVNRTAAWIRNLDGAMPADLAEYGDKPWAWLEDVAKPVLL